MVSRIATNGEARHTEIVREVCRIVALAYNSIGDFTEASDGFCDLCPHGEDKTNFRHAGHTIDYVRRAVVEKLKRDGYEIAKGFDPETGKEIQT